MKRCLSMMLAVLLLLTMVLAGSPEVSAAQKAGQTRAIAIVFDNSGSMYLYGEQAWCRATYAMEVFAAMLNKGDTLQIYPMHPIEVGGKTYTMDSPLAITDASQSSAIRDIYTPDAQGTPIESIDAAITGIQKVKADKKYMIVLTDGDVFYQGDKEMSLGETKGQLDQRFQNAGASLTMMYLGIGSKVVMPDTKDSEYFAKKQAKNSEDVLSALTEMCNKIFGRDTLPKNHISGNAVDFDISMNKLIVFVQGENLAGLKLSGSSGEVGEKISEATTKYSERGTGRCPSEPDRSLQGMMVTYTNCDAGTYTLEYSGKATSVEVYYEPDADLEFVFTDAAGNNVDPNALYEGDYKVSYGMKDGKTGKLIDSDLLGEPVYKGSYFINGEEHPISSTGSKGEVPVSLKMDDAFDANLTVTYLSGYTISKDSSDFGWPEGGIQVAARPAGELMLEISGGEDLYSLQKLEEGEPYIAKVFCQGEQLTGDALESVILEWEPETSNAEIKKEFADDHYKLSLHYKDPAVPQETVCGECTVSIYARYTAQGSAESQTQSPLTYNIEDDFSPLQMELFAPDDYIVIKELEDSRPIEIKLKVNGVSLTDEQFAAVDMQVDCGGIDYTLTPCPEKSAYEVKLHATDGIAAGDYPIEVTAKYTDNIGRQTQVEDGLAITLSTMPLWLKWLIGLGILLLLFLLIWWIAHIRRLPKLGLNKKTSEISMPGSDRQKLQGSAKIDRRVLTVQFENRGQRGYIRMNVTPAKDSYLYRRNVNKSAVVDKNTVTASGSATIDRITIKNASFVRGKNGFEPEGKAKSDLIVKDKTKITCEGTMSISGRKRAFTAIMPLTGDKKLLGK